MPTRKPLATMLGALTQHVRLHQDYLEYNNRLFLVHEGQLRQEIQDSLKKELSATAYAKAIQRVPSINLLVRIIDKLSRVYSEPVERTTSSASDQALVQVYEDTACVSSKMASANRMYNLHKCAALEPFIEDEAMQLRVQPANKFLFYSDDLVNPLRPTVYIKFMDIVRSVPFTDRDGQKVERDDPRWVQLYYMWSDTEFMVCDAEGQPRPDIMAERGLEGVNPLGRLPAAYINRSDFRLIPLPDTDTLDNTILIPKLLADLNYAVQFQSHSILVATDLNLPSDLAMNPDTVWDLTSKDEDKQGRFDAIQPKVDIDQVIGLIKATLAIWLGSRNIQAGDMGQMSPGDAASGLARIIDESDATQDRQAQCVRFQDVERDAWSLIAAMHNYAADAGLIKEKRKFSDDLRISVRFGEQKPVLSDTERIANAKEQISLGLMSRPQAVKFLRPALSSDDVTKWIDEIDADSPSGAITMDGPQLKSFVELMTAAGAGTIPKDTVHAILTQVFSISPEAADEICASLPSKEEVAANAQPGQAAPGNPGAAQGPGNSTAGGGVPPANNPGPGTGPGAGSTGPGQSDKPASPAKP